MADIRKRTGRKGTTYQVRYPTTSTKSGYAYATFNTRKEAVEFVEGGKTRETNQSRHTDIRTIRDAADLWLRICEKEGLNGREPVTTYTYGNYEYRAGFITGYDWKKELHELTPPDIVAFRSWLLQSGMSRDLAGKVLSSLQSILKEMTIRGILTHNVGAGICVRAESRYKQPVVIPSKEEVVALLRAADKLANSKNQTIAKAWRRYRPMLYLATDSGMRPQEYLALATDAITDDGVHVRRAIDGGGQSISVTKTPAGRRFIELSPDTIALVRHYIQNHSPENGHDLAFPSQSGGIQSRRNWQRRGFNVACLEAGLIETIEEDGEIVELPKYCPYDLRHFFASILIQKKVNLKKIQTLMGHTNIETTLNVYGHLLDDDSVSGAETKGMLSGMLDISCGKSVANRH